MYHYFSLSKQDNHPFKMWAIHNAKSLENFTETFIKLLFLSLNLFAQFCKYFGNELNTIIIMKH